MEEIALALEKTSITISLLQCEAGLQGGHVLEKSSTMTYKYIREVSISSMARILYTGESKKDMYLHARTPF